MHKERITFSGQELVSFWRKDQDAPKFGPRRSSTGRHRRTARLWLAWLRRAWPRVEIWSGWSEVTCGRSRPDALCWGQLDGYESLFWLEVESGNLSREELLGKTVRRINQALLYARRGSVRLVFALLGPPWVLDAVRTIKSLPGDAAFVLEDWRAFGRLPFPEWGTIQSGLRTQSSVC